MGWGQAAFLSPLGDFNPATGVRILPCSFPRPRLRKLRKGRSPPPLSPVPTPAAPRACGLTLLQSLEAAQLAVVGRLVQRQPALFVGLCEILPRLDHGLQGLLISFLDGLQHGIHRPVTARGGSLLRTQAGQRTGGAASLPEGTRGCRWPGAVLAEGPLGPASPRWSRNSCSAPCRQCPPQ